MKAVGKTLKNINLNEAVFVTLMLYLSMAFFSFALSNILLGIAGAFFVIGYLNGEITLKAINWKLYVVCVVPYLLTVISFFNSEAIISGLRYLNLRLPIIVVPFMLLSLKIEKPQIINGFKLLVVASLIACGVTFYNAVKYFDQDILFKTDFVHFITIIQHPYFGVLVLIALLSILEYQIISNKLFKWLVVIVFTLAIVLTTSRIVYISYFLAACFYLYSHFSRKQFILSFIAIAILSSIFLLFNKSVLNKFERSLDYDKSPRLKLWSNTFEAVDKTQSYYFGIGIGDFYKDKKDVYFAENYSEAALGTYGFNPHSQPIEFYLTNGIFGIVILLIAFMIYLKNLKSQSKFAHVIFIIIFLFSTVECILDRQYGVQIYAVLIPLLLTESFKTNETI